MSDQQRHDAIARIRAKRGFWLHLGIYVAVNAFLALGCEGRRGEGREVPAGTRRIECGAHDV